MKYEVFGIYYNGKLFKGVSRRSFYVREQDAKSAITLEAKGIAFSEVWKETGAFLHELSKDGQERWIEKIKKRFTIIPYIPDPFCTSGIQ